MSEATMSAVAAEYLVADHRAMQRHVPDSGDPDYCAQCPYEQYPCHERLLARERLIAAGHLVPDIQAPRVRQQNSNGHG